MHNQPSKQKAHVPRHIVLIVTVGASLIQNFRTALHDIYPGNSDATINTTIQQLLSGATISQSAEDNIKTAIQLFLENSKRQFITGESKWSISSGDAPNYLACAELQSIHQYLEEYLLTGQQVEVYFLASDTAISEISAKLIIEKLQAWYPVLFNKKKLHYKRIKGLQMSDAHQLADQGFGNILTYIMEIQNRIGNDKKLVINMTGGFKGIIPVLSLIAQLVSSNLIYSFEYSNDGSAGPLLEIPSMNMHFMWDFLEAYEPLLDRVIASTYRKHPVTLKAAEIEIIKKELIPLRICQYTNEQYTVAPLGKLLLSWIARRIPVGKSVLGFFLEYKFFEYLIEEPWQQYTLVRHSVRPFGKEVDLFLQNPVTKKWIWGEIKSYKKLKHAYTQNRNNNFGFQLQKSLKKLAAQSYPLPEAFHLYLYKRSFQTLQDEFCQTNLLRIKQLLQHSGIHQFCIFFVDLDLSLQDLTQHHINPYTSRLMPGKFSRNPAKFSAQNQQQVFILVQDLNFS